jgi:hypothetical protein
MKKIYAICLILSALFTVPAARASHLAGYDMTYQYLGDTTKNGVVYMKYQVNLLLRDNCLGQAVAISEDNPAYFSVYTTTGGQTVLVTVDSNVDYTSKLLLPSSAIAPCDSTSGKVCTQQLTFSAILYLPHSSSDYVVVYQRCCLNSALVNIFEPGNQGLTAFCTIPAAGAANNGAVFTNLPPMIVPNNYPVTFDCSATDADGDSLTYALSAGYDGANADNTKPIPGPPPFVPYN